MARSEWENNGHHYDNFQTVEEIVSALIKAVATAERERYEALMAAAQGIIDDTDDFLRITGVDSRASDFYLPDSPGDRLLTALEALRGN